ncbi:hypothetical protein L1987_40413 [Smallanthus sonchifolius]|uniref:Uncharacterized protein n=1 Tax=Smallanthus sonchifolius TaxID=185202 RepID=A0ACB9GUH1_9ASTR|nr:hypothetical protein L1987_40413 [Smallanthus sonchifolius]
MVATICDLKARVLSLEHLVGNILKVNDAQQALLVTQHSQLLVQQLQIESLNATLEKVLKQLAAQGESSRRQETLIIPEYDDDDTEGTHGRDEQPIASSMPSVSIAGDSTTHRESGGDGHKEDFQQKQVDENIREKVDKETIECLIDLNSVLIDDWVSDTEDAEIEF